MLLEYLRVSFISNIVKLKFDVPNSRENGWSRLQQDVPFSTFAVHLQIVHLRDPLPIHETFQSNGWDALKACAACPEVHARRHSRHRDLSLSIFPTHREPMNRDVSHAVQLDVTANAFRKFDLA